MDGVNISAVIFGKTNKVVYLLYHKATYDNKSSLRCVSVFPYQNKPR